MPLVLSTVAATATHNESSSGQFHRIFNKEVQQQASTSICVSTRDASRQLLLCATAKLRAHHTHNIYVHVVRCHGSFAVLST